MRARRAASTVAALASVAAAAGCGDLRLVRDDRVEIIAPREHAHVRGAFRLAWRARGLPVGGAFAVFVDTPPMRPGQGLGALARRDPLCRRLPRCPDRRWLRDHGVHVTRRTTVRVPTLSQTSGRRTPSGRRHEIVVVLLDRRGVRAGEGAWRRVLFTRDGGA